jgi:MoaA/NifB/PqqE/SkfB family radical SAM enzyme
MPLDLLTEALDQVARSWPRTSVGWAFTEPSIYPHLLPSLEHAQRRGLRTTMTTNGSRLPRLALDLVRVGLDELFVSLDGPADVHDAIRGQEGAWQRAVDGIARLNGTGPRVSIFACVTPWNVGHLERMLVDLQHLRLQSVGLMHTNYTTDAMAERHNATWGTRYPATASNVADLDVGDIDLDALERELGRIARHSWPFPVRSSPELPDRESLEVFYRRPEMFVGRRCGDAYRSLMLKSDGTLIPAHGRCYRVDVGNLKEDALTDVWNGAALREFRAALDGAGGLFPACARCCSAFER